MNHPTEFYKVKARWAGATDHDQAMDLATKAMFKKAPAQAVPLLIQAAHLEIQALQKFTAENPHDSLWSRVLHRSATWCAPDDGKPALARQLALRSHQPDPEVLDAIANLADAAATDGTEHPSQIH